MILDIFARPYALLDLKTVENIEGIVLSYQNSTIMQQKSAQILFGAVPAKGSIPVSIDSLFRTGDGIKYNALYNLSYGRPERVGMSSEALIKVDSVAQYAVDNQMTPGIQLLIARKGKVIYNKNFGKHTYDGNEIVKFDDIYDVASLTKILATLPLLMELEEKNVLTLDTKLKRLLPEYLESNKKNITIKEMLSRGVSGHVRGLCYGEELVVFIFDDKLF